MGDRSSLRAASGQPASSSLGMGGADLQRRRGAAEPGQSLLDAAAAWHPATEGARPGGLRDAATRRAHSDRVLPVLVLCAHAAVSAAGEVGRGGMILGG